MSGQLVPENYQNNATQVNKIWEIATSIYFLLLVPNSPTKPIASMGKQYNKVLKRRRRKEYLRRKAATENNSKENN